MRTLASCLATASLLLACPSCVPSRPAADSASLPQWSRVTSLDYGSRPVWTAALRSLAVAKGTQFLKDPSSAQIQYGEARRFVRFTPADGSYLAAWVLPYSVNGKNSYGAYAGADLHGMIIRNGQIVEPWKFLRSSLFDRQSYGNVNGFNRDTWKQVTTYEAVLP